MPRPRARSHRPHARSRSFPFQLAAAGLALAMAACATVSLPPPEIQRAALAAPSYSARLHASLKGPRGRGRSAVLLAFRRPDAMRIEIPGPTGARLVAVVREGVVRAVFPSDRAFYECPATAAGLDELLGVELAPEEIMDLLVGRSVPRLVSQKVRWGATLPQDVEARLRSGDRLRIKVEEAQAPVDLPAGAFEDPPHGGYRLVDGDEARRLWGMR